MAKSAGAKRSTTFRVLLVVVAFVIGTGLGLGIFTLAYAKGASYLSDEPTACINCHIMEEQYDGWTAGPHASFATCGDCHLPHDNVVSKYLVKGENGLHHGSKFTTGAFPENIEIRESSLRITNAACVYCHAELTDDVRHPGNYPDSDDFSCVRCHSDVGH